jgi:hypothetical protein
MEELYGSGWSLSTGLEVGVIFGVVELGGSMVAPGVTSAKLGSNESASSGEACAANVLARTERRSVECNMLLKE